MRKLRFSVVAFCIVIGVVLLVGITQHVDATDTIGVINIRPIIARQPLANALGLAYNPDANVIYIAHGSDGDYGHIYTIDMSGNLLSDLNFQEVDYPDSYPTSISYDRTTKHLFVLVYRGEERTGRVVEMSLDGSTLFQEFSLTPFGGGGITIREDGLWVTEFAIDKISHYSRNGIFLDSISVASSFQGFPGPYALASSVNNVFFVVDHFERRFFEFDRSGNQAAVTSTANLGDGRSMAIDTDLVSKRIFLSINNQEIYILPLVTQIKPTITIIKAAQPKSMQDFAYYGPFGKFYLDDAQPDDGDGVPTAVSYTVNPGTYNFAEGVFQSWYLADIQCTGTGQFAKDMLLRSVRITVQPADQMRCSFVTQRRVNLQAIKFNDLNADGIRQANEPTLTPWEFRFYKSDGTLINHKVNDANGSAVQNNVIPGSFKVCETPKPGWTNTLPGQIDPSLGLPCYSFTLQPGQNASLLFGNTQGPIVKALEEIDPGSGVITGDLPDINEPEGEETVEKQGVSQPIYLPVVSR